MGDALLIISGLPGLTSHNNGRLNASRNITANLVHLLYDGMFETLVAKHGERGGTSQPKPAETS